MCQIFRGSGESRGSEASNTCTIVTLYISEGTF
jgi:hypothetical protein